jgi:hypothetical protein
LEDALERLTTELAATKEQMRQLERSITRAQDAEALDVS